MQGAYKQGTINGLAFYSTKGQLLGKYGNFGGTKFSIDEPGCKLAYLEGQSSNTRVAELTFWFKC